LVSPRSNSPITYDDVRQMDGQMLRQQIYTDWLQRKRSFTKEESKLRKEKNEKEHEDKERAAHERKVDVSFFCPCTQIFLSKQSNLSLPRPGIV